MVRRILSFGLLAALAIGSLTSCIVRERTVAGPGRCPGGVWMEGHYGPAGRWHPGHWRCPGVVEVY